MLLLIGSPWQRHPVCCPVRNVPARPVTFFVGWERPPAANPEILVPFRVAAICKDLSTVFWCSLYRAPPTFCWRGFFLQINDQINPRAGFVCDFDEARSASFDQTRNIGVGTGNQVIAAFALVK